MNPVSKIKAPALLAMVAGLAASSANGQTLVSIFSEDFESFGLVLNVDEGFQISGPVCDTVFIGDAADCGGSNFNEVCDTGDPDLLDEFGLGDPSDNDPSTITCPAPFDGLPMAGDVFPSGAFNGLWAYEVAPGRVWTGAYGLPADTNGDGMVDGSDNPPATPGIGTAEWQGWSVADSQFWLQSDDQRRSEFFLGNDDDATPRGAGNVAIADPDEWDDFDIAGLDPSTGNGGYNAFFTSPAIGIAGVPENTVVLQFGSSWRPEAFDDDILGDGSDANNQTGELYAIFDGTTRVRVLRWESDALSPFFKDHAPNELVQINVPNPAGASTVEFEWSLINAGNDWWWAIDNIDVAAEGVPTEAPGSFALSFDSINTTLTPSITWTQALNATEYAVQFANDDQFTDVVVSDLTTDLMYTPAGGELLPGSYFVRVIAQNQIGSSEETGSLFVTNSIPADLDDDGDVDGVDVDIFSVAFASEFAAQQSGNRSGGGSGVAGDGVNGRVFYTETFEGVALTDSPQEGAEQDPPVVIPNVWSQDFASIGWAQTFVGNDGMDDWNGFAIADGQFWDNVAGQGRGQFTAAGTGYGDGAVVIGDGDEWDDADIGGAGDSQPMLTTATSPAISLPGDLAQDSLVITFAESFRSETPQTTDLEVSFDGGVSYTNILSLDSNSGDQQNGRRSIALNNPAGATDVTFRWTYEAVNDWWYAFDNITLTGDTANADTDIPSVFGITGTTVAPDGTVTIDFEEAFGASTVDFEVATDVDFMNIVNAFSAAPGDGSANIAAGALGNGTYYVRATARNAQGDRNSAGASASFQIDLTEGVVVWEEDWEAAVLGASPQEDPAQLDVWSDDFASLGWARTFMGNDGMDDWNGYALTNGIFWDSIAGQQRDEFVTPGNGYSDGTIAVADGDEWDDADVGANGDTEPMLTSITSPVVMLPADTAADSVRLTYAESFRSEDPQTTDIEVSFDGGATFTNVLALTPADPSSPNGQRSLLLSNPAGASQFQFRVSYEGVNDWWYALDNITLTAGTMNAHVAEPSVFGLSGASGVVNTAIQSYTVERSYGAESYQLLFATDENFNNVVFTQDVSFGTTNGPALTNGIYYVKAVSTNASGSRDSAQTLQVLVDGPFSTDFDGNGIIDSYDVLAYERLVEAALGN